MLTSYPVACPLQYYGWIANLVRGNEFVVRLPLGSTTYAGRDGAEETGDLPAESPPRWHEGSARREANKTGCVIRG